MDYEMRKLMFSSIIGNWRTSQDLFDQLDKEFHFNLDVCADEDHLLKKMPFYTNMEGLNGSWLGYRCFMNPPYGKEISKWLAKADNELILNQTLTVALLPARTDTYWFWDYCARKEIRFIRGRLKFSNHKNYAPFPSMIVVFKPDSRT